MSMLVFSRGRKLYHLRYELVTINPLTITIESNMFMQKRLAFAKLLNQCPMKALWTLLAPIDLLPLDSLRPP